MSIDHRESETFFSEDRSIETVVARMADCNNPRLKQVMEVIVRKLHEAVKEIEPTEEEWLEAIVFLTRTGQACNDWRQEYILLSDVLGVSMLVDAINNRKPKGASESTVLGPFHVADAPRLEMGANISLDGKGAPMFVHGRITDTYGNPIEGVTIDVWQANDEGSTRPAEGHPAGVQPARRLQNRRRRSVLVPGREAEILPRPDRWPRRPAPQAARATSIPSRPPALYPIRRGLREIDHAYL